MKNYMATGSDSGHKIILHGDKALREYRESVRSGEAEGLRNIESVDLRKHRSTHAHVCEAGQCYGPCGLEAR